MDKENDRLDDAAPMGCRLSKRQWSAIASVSAAALVVGPIAAAGAAVGRAGGCYLSNQMGWSED